jgi:hypothetical protein
MKKRTLPGLKTEPVEVIHVSVTEPGMFSTAMSQKTTRTTLTHVHGTMSQAVQAFHTAYANMRWFQGEE